MPATHSTPAAARLVDAQSVATLLSCEPRLVYRLSQAGRMPAPVRLFSFVRWDRLAIKKWIDGGCKPVDSSAPGGEPAGIYETCRVPEVPGLPPERPAFAEGLSNFQGQPKLSLARLNGGPNEFEGQKGGTTHA